MKYPTIYMTFLATKSIVIEYFPMNLHEGEVYNEQVLNDLSDNTILEVGLNTHCCKDNSVGAGDKLASYKITYCKENHEKVADLYGCFLTKHEDLALILHTMYQLIAEAKEDGK